jgi:hypothetical protein
MLSYVWDQSKAGGTPGAVQSFLAPVDKYKLEQAPKISRTHRTDLPPDWVQKVYAFYGALPGAIGAPGSATVSSSGAASGGTAAAGTTTTPSGVAVGAGEGVAVPPVVYTDSGGGFIVGLPLTNTVTNTLLPTNVIGSNVFVGGSNVFVGGSNIFAGGTNVFAGGTNVFAGGTNGFEGGTNVFGGSSNFPVNPNLVPNTNATIQGSNGTQVARPVVPGPQFTPSDLNRRQNTSGGTSGTTPQTAAPGANAPATGTAPGTSALRRAPMAPSAGTK